MKKTRLFDQQNKKISNNCYPEIILFKYYRLSKVNSHGHIHTFNINYNQLQLLYVQFFVVNNTPMNFSLLTTKILYN